MDKVVLDLSAMVAISMDESHRSLRRLLTWQMDLFGVSSELPHLHQALEKAGFPYEEIAPEIKNWSHRVHFSEPIAPGTVVSEDISTDAAPALASEIEAVGLISADSDRLATPSFTDPNGHTIGIFPPPLTGNESYPWSRPIETQTVVLDLSAILQIYTLPEVSDLLHYSSLNPQFDLVVTTKDIEEARRRLVAASNQVDKVEGFITALESASTLVEEPKGRAFYEDKERDRAVAVAKSLQAEAVLTEDDDLLAMKNWEGITFLPPLSERESRWVDGKVVILPSWFELLTQARDAADETVIIFSAPDELTANLACEILEENGIDTIVVAEQVNIFSGVPQDPGGHWGVVRVLSHDAWRAREILSERLPEADQKQESENL